MQLILCDPHAMFRDAFSSLLSVRGHDVIACTRALEEVMDLMTSAEADELSADVVVTEIAFPGVPEVTAITALRAAVPDTPIAVLTGESEPSRLRAALEAGADGVAIKTESVDEVERVLLHLSSPAFTKLRYSATPEKVWSRRSRSLMDQSIPSHVDQQPTPREREVINLLARGAGTPEIAEVLGVGTTTVRTHLQHLFIKLGVHSRLELVAFAIREGLVDDVRGSLNSRSNS